MIIWDHVFIRIHRETKRNVWISRSNMFWSYPLRPCVADGHLANTQDGTTCQGLPWAPDSLWWRLDFAADQGDLRGQTDCRCILPWMLPKSQFGCTASHLCFTCMNPAEDRDSQGKQQTEGISSSSLSWFYSALQGGAKISVRLLLADDLAMERC